MNIQKDKIPPVHPGEILQKEFLEPLDLSQNKVALSIGVHPRRINQIVKKERSVTADTALRLGKFFDVFPEFWMKVQSRYDLESARESKNIPQEARPLNEIRD